MKLGYELIDKLHSLTECEWNLLLYVVKAENQETGCVEGVFYLDVMQHTSNTKQRHSGADNSL